MTWYSRQMDSWICIISVKISANQWHHLLSKDHMSACGIILLSRYSMCIYHLKTKQTGTCVLLTGDNISIGTLFQHSDTFLFLPWLQFPVFCLLVRSVNITEYGIKTRSLIAYGIPRSAMERTKIPFLLHAKWKR